MSPPLLRLRVSEAMLTSEHKPPIVEVLTTEGEVWGQLPATAASYEAKPNGIGTLTIKLLVEKCEVQTHA